MSDSPKRVLRGHVQTVYYKYNYTAHVCVWRRPTRVGRKTKFVAAGLDSCTTKLSTFRIRLRTGPTQKLTHRHIKIYIKILHLFDDATREPM